MDSLQFLVDYRDPSVWLAWSVVCLIGLVSYQYYRNTYNYWPKRGVNGPRPWPLVADLPQLLSRNRMALQLDRLRKYGKIYGTFVLGRPYMLVSDAELMRQICIKDFDNFQDHEGFKYFNNYQRNFLLFLRGQHWKRVRALTSPCFTSGKMRKMFQLMLACSDDLVDHYREQLAKNIDNSEIVDLTQLYSSYTIDAITTCCYGMRLKRERGAKKSKPKDNLLDDCLKATSFSTWRAIVSQILPQFLLNSIKFELNPTSTIKPLLDRVENMIKLRQESAGSKKNDLLQMLADAKLDDQIELDELDRVENHHAGLSEDSLINYQTLMQTSLSEEKNLATRLSDLEILSEAVLMLIMGADTTRLSLSTISYLLAHNQAIQERLYEELSTIADYNETLVGKHLVFDYDKLISCQYLDAVVSESLRFFTPAPFTDRRVNEDYLIKKYNIKLEAGSRLLFDLHSLHNNPEYWCEPSQFNPNRFMPGERDKIVPGSYAPFSLGPRHCIGMRFSLMETKLGLAKVVMNFKLVPASGTCYPPLGSSGIGLTTIKDCRVRVVAREIVD